MTAKSIDIVDAVVTRLSAASYSLSITASKSLFNITQLEELTSVPELSVLSAPEKWQKTTRGSVFTKDYDIEIVVRATCDDENDSLAALMDLCEEIKEDFAAQRMAELNCIAINHAQQYDLEMLLESGIFYSTITLTYRGL